MKLTPKLGELYQSLLDQKASGSEGADVDDLLQELEAVADLLAGPSVSEILSLKGVDALGQTRAHITGGPNVCRFCGQPFAPAGQKNRSAK